MINSIQGPSQNPYIKDTLSNQQVLPKTEPVIQTSFNSGGQNPDCPMYKNPNQKEKKEQGEFDQEKANKVFNPYCLVCSQAICNIKKNLLADGSINTLEYGNQAPLIGTIINLEV